MTPCRTGFHTVILNGFAEQKHHSITMVNLMPTLLLYLLIAHNAISFSIVSSATRRNSHLFGWIQRDNDEWEWQEDDPNYERPSIAVLLAEPSATPKLPAGSYKPKQSLGQNYLQDANTVAKILRTFYKDASRDRASVDHVVELGPGAGALTDKLVETYGASKLHCIEIDERSVEILTNKHPGIRVDHQDVMQVDYFEMARQAGQPLSVIGNLPYYITSQILFSLADASHLGAIYSATVTMQWEVAERMVAKTCTKDYGILSVVFQIYADVKRHFKIPPTVFYPKPKVDSALVGLHFQTPSQLRKRLAGVSPTHLRRVVTNSFQQRRKTIRNSLKKLSLEICNGNADEANALLESLPVPLPTAVQTAIDAGDKFASTQGLPSDWATKRPEELTPGQFIELTRLLFGPAEGSETDIDNVKLGIKVWRKLKHGANE
jgi:16S rRNA (adenine1518-N6/adenine1519-N6)-dimethyltransferase